MASGEVGPDDADPLARLERGEQDWGDIGGGDDALSELEGAFHPVTVDGADHLNGSLGLVLWGNFKGQIFSVWKYFTTWLLSCRIFHSGNQIARISDGLVVVCAAAHLKIFTRGHAQLPLCGGEEVLREEEVKD